MIKYTFMFLPLLFLVTAVLHAEEKHHGPEAIEVRIETGTKDGALKFVPDRLSFERGKYYKLVIHNPGNDEHYFTSEGLATHVFTRKVEVSGNDHKTIAEIHGAVNDIELKPGATVEWYFYPMTNGTRTYLIIPHEPRCCTNRLQARREAQVIAVAIAKPINAGCERLLHNP